MAQKTDDGPTDIQLASIEELVEELMRRETFRGVVIWQRENFKGDYSGLANFRWRSQRCDVDIVCESLLPGMRKAMGR